MQASGNTLTLGQLGERRILNELIAPRFPLAVPPSGTADDCAVLPRIAAGGSIVATIDPCPTPIICIIEAVDYYHYGRMTMLINVSDLAAMGATPLGILVSTTMPEDMLVSDYNRFLEGVDDASHEWDCPVIGGNIKDGSPFTATGSAFGSVIGSSLMRRSGALPGDLVCVVGDMGLFWSAIFSRNIASEIAPAHRVDLERALYRPVARIVEGIKLAELRSVTSCIDSSDGIAGSLYQLADASKVDIVVEDELLNPHPAVYEVARMVDIDPRKLMMSWGNWELVFTVRAQHLTRVAEMFSRVTSPWSVIGKVTLGSGCVWLNTSGRLHRLRDSRSERFTKVSYFTHGIAPYMDLLRNDPLIESI